MVAAVFSAVMVYTYQTKQCHMVIAMRILNCIQENGLFSIQYGRLFHNFWFLKWDAGFNVHSCDIILYIPETDNSITLTSALSGMYGRFYYPSLCRCCNLQCWRILWPQSWCVVSRFGGAHAEQFQVSVFALLGCNIRTGMWN